MTPPTLFPKDSKPVKRVVPLDGDDKTRDEYINYHLETVSSGDVPLTYNAWLKENGDA